MLDGEDPGGPLSHELFTVRARGGRWSILDCVDKQADRPRGDYRLNQGTLTGEMLGGGLNKPDSLVNLIIMMLPVHPLQLIHHLHRLVPQLPHLLRRHRHRNFTLEPLQVRIAPGHPRLEGQTQVLRRARLLHAELVRGASVPLVALEQGLENLQGACGEGLVPVVEGGEDVGDGEQHGMQDLDALLHVRGPHALNHCGGIRVVGPAALSLQF
mmetsp:Transcript_80231/g.214375  ORF Transcript_80231/g.214375 Transcript_80231/m.214375 type:complete len:213 (-) Transcript_80231:345-983(-)